MHIGEYFRYILNLNLNIPEYFHFKRITYSPLKIPFGHS
jgi:hypothetical protein